MKNSADPWENNNNNDDMIWDQNNEEEPKPIVFEDDHDDNWAEHDESIPDPEDKPNEKKEIKKSTYIVIAIITGLVILIVILFIVMVLMSDENKKSKSTSKSSSSSTISESESITETSTMTADKTTTSKTITTKKLTDAEKYDYTEFDTTLIVRADEIENLPLRDEPTIDDSKILTTIPDGTTVHVIGFRDTGTEVWFRVEYEGKEGWCRGGMLQPNNLALLDDKQYDIKGLEKWKSKFQLQYPSSDSDLGNGMLKGTIYYIPDLSSGVVKRYLKATEVFVTAAQGDWYYVYNTEDAISGWVYKDQLKIKIRELKKPDKIWNTDEGDVYEYLGEKTYLYYGPDTSSYEMSDIEITQYALIQEQGRAENGKWLYVHLYNGNEYGWIKNDNNLHEMTEYPGMESGIGVGNDFETGKVIKDTTLRRGPNSLRDPVPECETVPKGGTVRIYASRSGWSYVVYSSNWRGDSFQGWINSDHIEIEKMTTTTTTKATTTTTTAATTKATMKATTSTNSNDSIIIAIVKKIESQYGKAVLNYQYRGDDEIYSYYYFFTDDEQRYSVSYNKEDGTMIIR